MESTDDNLDGQYRHQQDAGVADLSRASWTGRREAETGLETVLLSSMPFLPYVCRTCPVCLAMVAMVVFINCLTGIFVLLGSYV